MWTLKTHALFIICTKNCGYFSVFVEVIWKYNRGPVFFSHSGHYCQSDKSTNFCHHHLTAPMWSEIMEHIKMLHFNITKLVTIFGAVANLYLWFCTVVAQNVLICFLLSSVGLCTGNRPATYWCIWLVRCHSAKQEVCDCDLWLKYYVCFRTLTVLS